MFEPIIGWITFVSGECVSTKCGEAPACHQQLDGGRRGFGAIRAIRSGANMGFIQSHFPRNTILYRVLSFGIVDVFFEMVY